MVKPLRFAFAAAIAAVSLAGSAQAQTYSGNVAIVEVVPSVNIGGGPRSLNFGRIFIDSNVGARITINPNTNNTYTSTGVIAVLEEPTVAEVLVSGAPNALVRVTLPPEPLKLLRSSSSIYPSQVQELDLTDLTISPGSTFNFDSTGSEMSIYIGGTLNIPSSAAGMYSVTLPVTFNYE